MKQTIFLLFAIALVVTVISYVAYHAITTGHGIL